MSDARTQRTFVEIDRISLHYQTLDTPKGGTPIVFLHEGLGSVELWRDFPVDVVSSTGRRGVVYSRYGNGWSTPLSGPRQPDYMHREALDVLPEVLGELVDRPPILVGHSDGASIALIYAGSGHPVVGLVLIAPHVFVEPETVRSIGAIRERFPTSDMAEKMARYHQDPERTFYGWADVWLSEGFRSWNIEEYVPGVRCPTLLIQGDADEYGTVRQLEAISSALDGPSRKLLVEGAEHSPHLSHADLVSMEVMEFISGLEPT